MALQDAPPFDVVAAIATIVRAGVVVPAARQFSGATQATEPSEEIAGGLKEIGCERERSADSQRSRRSHIPHCTTATSRRVVRTRGGLDREGGGPASVAVRETNGLCCELLTAPNVVGLH